MAPRSPADEKLRRLLHVLPAAAREGGARLSELSDQLGVPRDRVLRDLEEVTARAFYHRAGGADRLQIAVESDRVSVWTAGQFERPVKLTPREALALHLALRGHPAPGGDEVEQEDDAREERRDLARRLERELAVDPVEDDGHVAFEDQAAGDRTRRIRSILFRAAREGRRCEIRYLSSGAEAPSRRTLAPYTMLYADGRWYALGRSGAAAGGEGGRGDEESDAGGDGGDGDGDGDVRIFRCDRVLEAALREEGFEVPDGFDPADHLTDGAPYDPHDPVEARVRYSPRIARWIREKGPVDEEEDDGSVVVAHSVSDPDWLVRHVLRYGPDAEVLTPPRLRRRVAEAARGMAENGS